MRRKFARRWRREALRRGADIVCEERILTKCESNAYGSLRGFCVEARYKLQGITCIGKDELEAFRSLIGVIDYIDTNVCRANGW